jgi:ATP-binding cassette subfamily C protein LapB
MSPDGGTILVDGVGLNQYAPAELRAGIGYLPQDAELFTGTLRENLVIGRPQASDAEIQRALHVAGLDQFVAASPDGLEMQIGERGNRLSGGQRQGVALARLVLRRTPVLFLDEPTNAMDQQMEATVTARLRALGDEGVGMILCTHRQSLAQVADRFIVLDQGRKVLDGPREQIMTRLASQKLPDKGQG